MIGSCPSTDVHLSDASRGLELVVPSSSSSGRPGSPAHGPSRGWWIPAGRSASCLDSTSILSPRCSVIGWRAPSPGARLGDMPELPSDFPALPQPQLDLGAEREALADFYDYADLL